MDIQIHKIEEITYSPTSICALHSGEHTETVKLRLRDNKRCLIFLPENLNLRGGENPQEHKIIHKVDIKTPSNYVLAIDNLKRYGDATFRLAKTLKNSFLPTHISYNTTMGDEIFGKLTSCNRLDEDPSDFRNFLLVSKEVVLKCIDNQDLDPEKKALYTTILLNFYTRANSLYTEEYGKSVSGGFASVPTRTIVNTERTFLTQQTGIYLNTYEKAFLFNLLKILDSQFQIIQNYKNNLESLQTAWSKLLSTYEILQKISETTIVKCNDNLTVAKETIARLNLALSNAEKNHLFFKYWKVISITMLVIIFLLMIWVLILHILKAPFQVNNWIQAPKGEFGNDMIPLDKAPTTAPIIDIPLDKAPTSTRTPIADLFSAFSKLHGLLCIETVIAFFLLKEKFIGVRDDESSIIRELRRKEIDSIIHQKKLNLLEAPRLEADSLVRTKTKKDFLETTEKIGDDIVTTGKLVLVSTLLKLIGRK